MNARAQDVSTVIDHETGIAIPPETSQAIAEMNLVEAGLAELQAKFSHDPDCSTDDGYAQAKAEAKEIASVRISVDKAHKAGKSFYLEGGRRIDAMKNSILAVTNPLEDARKIALKAVDDELERIAQEQARREQARIEQHEEGIRNIDRQLQSVTIEDIDRALKQLAGTSVEAFEEFAEVASERVTEVVGVLEVRRVSLQLQADEAARLAAQAAEQAETQRKLDEQARLQAEQTKAEQDKLAQDKADFEAWRASVEKAEAEKVRQAEEAERKKQREAEDARQFAEMIEQAHAEAIQEDIERTAAADAYAEQLAALAPEAVKLNAYMAKVLKLKMPEVETDKCLEVLAHLRKAHAEAVDMIGAMQA